MDTIANIPTRPETPSGEALQAWLDYTSADLVERLRELSNAMLRLSVDHPAIESGDDETAGIFTENLRMIGALRKAVEELYRKEKAPYWTLGKRVDTWFGGIVKLLDAMGDPLREALRDFTTRREKARLFEEKEPVRGPYGGTATLRNVWDFEVEDITKVPAEYLMVSTALVRAAMADRDPKTRKPRKTIPGIKWVRKQNLAVS